MSIIINGVAGEPPADPRVSLLDHLRETLHLTGTKKGCNQGACGACTVLVDGERILSCLALAVQYDGRQVTTIRHGRWASEPSAVRTAVTGASRSSSASRNNHVERRDNAATNCFDRTATGGRTAAAG